MNKISVIAAGLLLCSASAMAADNTAGCAKPGTPASLEGQVVKMDPAQGKVTVKSSDGTMHEFQTAKETMAKYKIGDTIKAKLRC